MSRFDFTRSPAVLANVHSVMPAASPRRRRAWGATAMLLLFHPISGSRAIWRDRSPP